MRVPALPFLHVVMLPVLLAACTAYSGKSFVPSLPGYKERDREVFVLKKRLLEISGLVYLGDNRVAAINDEKGDLFIVDIKDNSDQKYAFKGKGDYEDIAKTDSMFYVLESNGDVYEVSNPPHVRSSVFHFTNKPKKTEFETLVWYKQLNKLVLISKEQRSRWAGISAYTFDLATQQFDSTVLFHIPEKEILQKLEDYSAECKPSGGAIHPLTGKLFLIASVGKSLLQCTADGKLEKIYKLNPAQFPQPEGINFAANGDMYISNEGLDGKATILKFPYSGGR